jgi:hypothetical protein
MKSRNKNKYSVFLPIYDRLFKESVDYTFGESILLEDNNDYKKNEQIIDSINDSDVEQVIFFDDLGSYRQIIPCIDHNKEIKFIFTHNISSLTNGDVFSIFNTITEFYDRDIIKKIGVTDKDLYEAFKKNSYNVSYIILDNVIKSKSKMKRGDTIGMLGFDFDPNNNFYNLLSALVLVNYSSVKILKPILATERFLELFNIKFTVKNNIEGIIKNSYVNLYANFTNSNIEYILKSMDYGIPCILGNTSLFDGYPILKEKLVLHSDDDIGEIADKINNIKTDESELFNEYKKFRKNYSSEANVLTNEFLE